MEDTIKQRLMKFIEENDISIRKFERTCGLSNGYLKSLRDSPTVEMMKRILDSYPEINGQWLMYGKGKMQNAKPDKSPGSPYFNDVSVCGGQALGAGDEQAIEPSGYMSVPGAPSNIFFVKVRGNSMLNTKDPKHSIPDGSWIGLQRVTSSSVHWGEIYAFMTSDGAMVKILRPSNKEGYVLCCSVNEGYEPFEQSVEEILGGALYHVRAVVNVNVW